MEAAIDLENFSGEVRIEMHTPSGFPMSMRLQRAELHSSPEPTVSCACCGLSTCEITETEGCLGEQPLPPFDPSVERTAHGDALSDAIASGEVKVSREDVDIEEVIARINEHLKENENGNDTQRQSRISERDGK